MGYLFLAIAIVAEVTATLALKASDGFTKPLPSAVVMIGYSTAFYFLALVLKTVPIGVTYAVWAGLGIVLVTLGGAVAFKQVPDRAAIVGIALIVTGVVVLNLFSETAGHEAAGDRASQVDETR